MRASTTKWLVPLALPVALATASEGIVHEVDDVRVAPFDVDHGEAIKPAGSDLMTIEVDDVPRVTRHDPVGR